ncbi:hypothetical protein GCM10007967_08160 [Xylanimonas ulmi]
MRRATAAGTAGVLLAGGLLTTAGPAAAASAHTPAGVGRSDQDGRVPEAWATGEDAGQPAPDSRWESVVALDFEDGETGFGADGGALAVVDDPRGAGLVLETTRTADWHGLQLPGDLFTPGGTYRLTADVSYLDGPSSSLDIRFVGSPGFDWIGNQDVALGDWATVSGQWQVPADGADHVRLVAGAGLDAEHAFLADGVRVERYVGAATEPEDEFEAELVHTWDFSDDADLANVEAFGGVAMRRIPSPDGQGDVLAVERGDDDWRAPVFGEGLTQPGALYRLDVTARTDERADAHRIEFRAMPGFGYAAGGDIAADVWTTVSTTWRAGATPAMMVQAAGTGPFTYFLDSVELWRVEPAPAVDEDWEFDGLAFDFEDGAQGWFGRDASGVGPVLEHVSPGADSQGAIRISGRGNQGDGPMLDVVDLLAPMTRFEFEADIRFVDHAAGGGEITLSSQTGASTFTNLVQNMAVGNDWTRVAGEFMMPAFTTMANLYFETPWQAGATGDTTAFEVDNVRIGLPAPLEWERDLLPLQATLPGIATGVAVDSRELHGEHAELLLHHFNHLVGENHMKPEAWYDGAGAFRMHPEAVEMLDFAQEHGLTVFGHVLVWHSQTPAWFFAGDDGEELPNTPQGQEEMLRRMREHIGRVAGAIAERYGPFGSPTNPVSSYEVANEVVANNSVQAQVAGGLRPNSPWTRIFTPYEGSEHTHDRFLIEAFQAADHYLNGVHHVSGTPQAPASGDDRITLWVNDYNTERGLVRPDNEATKRWQLLELTNRLLDAGAPVDGVGHQFHAGLEWQVEGLRYALELFAYDNGWVNAPVLQAVTEVDVTIPPSQVGEAGLIAQGHYYRQAFDIIREHQVAHGDVDTVTIWGLTDGRSWRAAQLPLLFNDDLTAKPAFFGAIQNHHILTDATGLPERPDGGDWSVPPLETVVQEGYAFGADIALDDASFDAPAWGQLPAHALSQGAGQFHLRWTPEHVTVLANVNGLWNAEFGQPYSLQVVLGQSTAVVASDGTVSGDADAIVRGRADGFDVIVQVPHDGVTEGDRVEFDVRRVDDSGRNHGSWAPVGEPGQVTFVEPLSFVEIPRTPVRPQVDGEIDDAWAAAATIRTETRVEGAADGAQADVRTLWYDNGQYATLYLLVEVADPVIDTTSANSHEQDSVEVFVGLADRVPGGHHLPLYDAQFRVSAAGDVSFGQGDTQIQAERLTSAARVVEGGYVVEVGIRMSTGTGHQAGQWNDSLSGLGFFHGFDVQVNDASGAGTRTAVHSWGDPTGASFQSTARWGVALLGDLPETAPEPEVPAYDAWEAERVYVAGDRVVFDGRVFEAQWWTQRQEPGASPWCSWMELGAVVTTHDGQDVRAWTASWVFTGGEVVEHEGQLWRARWWTRNQTPGDPHGPWERVGSAG